MVRRWIGCGAVLVLASALAGCRSVDVTDYHGRYHVRVPYMDLPGPEYTILFLPKLNEVVMTVEQTDAANLDEHIEGLSKTTEWVDDTVGNLQAKYRVYRVYPLHKWMIEYLVISGANIYRINCSNNDRNGFERVCRGRPFARVLNSFRLGPAPVSPPSHW